MATSGQKENDFVIKIMNMIAIRRNAQQSLILKGQPNLISMPTKLSLYTYSDLNFKRSFAT